MRSRYGRYEVLSKLGQGAMAQVFLARDPILSRLVAVKVLHADLAERKDVLKRFFNEARTVALVRNPHVVEVFDFGQEGNDLFLVMEFVDGMSLQALIRRLPTCDAPAAGRPPEALADPGPGNPAGAGTGPGLVEAFPPMDAILAAALMCQAAEGLSIAARHGVVHRDIKPENLMINRQGYLKISDFGIAHVQDDSLTKTGAVLGSPHFMSPEQARGLKPITSQADMFSLGSVFYCCLAGRPPFRGKNIADLIRTIAARPHVPLRKLRPDLEPALASMVETLMSKDPASRGGGPRWLHRLLKEYLTDHGASDPAEVIAGHMRVGAGPAAQSTWRMDAPEPVYPPMASVTEADTLHGKQRRPAGMSGWVLAGLCFAAIGGIIGLVASTGLADISGAVADLAGFRDGSSTGAQDGLKPGQEAGEGMPTPPDVRPGIGIIPSGLSEPKGFHAVSQEEGLYPVRGSGTDIGSQRDFREARDAPPAGEGLPAPVPAQAVLLLRSSPPFADVFVDGSYVGVTPLQVLLEAAGTHRLVLRVKDVPELDTLLSLGPGTHDMKLRLDFDALARIEADPDSGE